MHPLILILFCTWLAGFSAFIGGSLAGALDRAPDVEMKHPLYHGIIAFGGGNLYLIFQDIAPQAKLTHHWVPPLGAVLGFIVGVLGKQWIG